MGRRDLSILALWLSLGVACGDDVAAVDGGAPDVQVPDAGPPDSGPDSGSSDAAPSDVGVVSDAAPRVDARPEFDGGPDFVSPLRVEVTIDPADFEQFYANPEDREFEPSASVVFDGEEYDDVEMEVHGGFARMHPKLSFRLSFDSDEPLETDIFSGDDEEEHRRVVLQASWIDPTYARNCITFDLIRAEGGLAPRCSHAELFVNGDYHGFYVIIERVDEEFLERNGLNPEGLLLKAENHSANWADKPNPLDGMAQKGNEEADTTPYAELLVALSETPTDFESFQEEVATRLNLNDWMLWQGVHTLADNRDTFTKNYYLYFDPDLPDGVFRIISWDADATWGINWDATVVEPTTMAISGHDPFARRILRIEGYRIPYVSRFEVRVDTISSNETTLLARLEEQHTRLAYFIRRDLEHWGRDLDEEALYEALRAAIVTRFEIMRDVVSTAR